MCLQNFYLNYYFISFNVSLFLFALKWGSESSTVNVIFCWSVFQIQHFQEVEISQVQMEEREKCRQEMLEVRRQLERNYEMKLEALMSREKNAIERLQKQQQVQHQGRNSAQTCY